MEQEGQKTSQKSVSWLPIHNKPFLISGPCSAETEEQTLETARRLKTTNKVHVFRAGVWKPRTRPGSFEGVGEKALPWLKKVKEETGFPITVEVAKAEHVDLCLKAQIDILWIGARSTANPFAVQEIADALKGIDIPVFVKNPINADLPLWLGAIERMARTGVNRIGSIHRGFSYFGEKYYRNRPLWQLAIAFKNEMPEIPLICDPSHICGRRDILQDVAQKSLDLNFDGLMLESHIDPDNAWSDAAQQLTPDGINDLVENLVLREYREWDVGLKKKIDLLRDQIDNIDEEIYTLLANRMKVAEGIGKYKKENNMTILQPKRWSEIIERGKEFAEKFDLSEDFILKYLQSIHEESINKQDRIMRNNL